MHSIPSTMILTLVAALSILTCNFVAAQPSPDVQAKISEAIQDAIDSPTSNPDYASFVNPFIGTGTRTTLLSSSNGSCIHLDNEGDVW